MTSLDGETLVRFLLIFGFVIFLIVALAWILKKLSLVTSRVGKLGEEARLSVSEAVAVDHRRKLVLVKRDHVEHLILIGGENDLLLEHAIPPHARPQPQTPPQYQQQGQHIQSRPAPEDSRNNAGKTTKAPEVTSQKASKPMASNSDAPTSKSPPSPKVEKLAAPISSALSALSPKSSKGERAAKPTEEQPNKSEPLKNSAISKAEASKTPLPPQQTAGPAQAPIREQKSASQETHQPDIVANWRPARPQARPTPVSKPDATVQKADAPQPPRGPSIPPLAPTQPPATQQAPAQPEASPVKQAPQSQNPIQPTELGEEKVDETSNKDETNYKSVQRKPDDQQTMETNYQDEITRLLDELSNDSNKS